jgi:hypothetical protein
MATPKYDALVAKVRDWANKPEVNTIPDSVIKDCLNYSADFCYQKLRTPQLESTLTHTIVLADNVNTSKAYTAFNVPEDLVEFLSIRCTLPTNNNYRFVETTDKKTFFEQYKTLDNTYSWMWRDENLYIYPQLPVGTVIESTYYCKLGALDSSDNAGTEVYNWLRDDKEYILLWGSLSYLGAYLFDDALKTRYKEMALENIEILNVKEDKARSLVPMETRQAVLTQNTRKVTV